MKHEVKLTQTNSPAPASLIQLAIEKGSIDTVQLEKLMDMQERWEKKEAKKTYLDAFSKFQATVPEIKKNRTATIAKRDGSGAFSYKFADLAGIAASIKSALQKNGLSYRWEFKDENNVIKCTCFISHRDGHTETATMEAGKDNSGAKNDIQQKGSTQTYLQRYTLIGALGLSTAEQDNDAKGSANKQQPGQQQQQQKPVKIETITDENEKEILGQWQQLVDGCKTKLELTSKYLQNKKTVDGDEKIQAIFKTRETKLKGSATVKPTMP